MSIIYQIPTQLTGSIGIFPAFKYMVVGDNLDAVTTPGYLNQINLDGTPINATDVIQAIINFNPSAKTGDYYIFNVTIDTSNGQITLIEYTGANGSIQPGTVGQLAYYETNGAILSALPVVADGTFYIDDSGAVASVALTDGQLLIGNSTGAPAAANLTAGTNVTIDNASNAITISANTGSGLATTTVTTTPVTMVANTKYIVNVTGNLCSFTLPTTASVGQVFVIIGYSTNGFIINQNAGQNIVMYGSSTTVGVDGSFASTARYQTLEIVCVVADTTFSIVAAVGNFTIV